MQRALHFLGVDSLNVLLDLQSPFYDVAPGDDSDHIEKLPKMFNGRAFLHAFGIFLRDMLLIVRVSVKYGRRLQQVLPSGLLGYVDRQDPGMVAGLFIPPVQAALAAIEDDVSLAVYLNHSREVTDDGQATLSKQVGAADTYSLAFPLFTAFDATDGGRILVLGWDSRKNSSNREPKLHFCLLQTPPWGARWQGSFLADDAVADAKYTVYACDSATRRSFDIAMSRPAGPAILRHVVHVGEAFGMLRRN